MMRWAWIQDRTRHPEEARSAVSKDEKRASRLRFYVSQSPHLVRRLPGLAQAADRRRTVSLGQALALSVAQQAMMPIVGRGQVQQFLQQAVDVRRLDQVLAARHQGDALQRVVHG